MSDIHKSRFTAEQFEAALKAVPSIGENKHWFIGGVDTGVLAEGLTPYIGDNGNWWIGETDTGIYARGIKVNGAEVGQTVVIKAIDENGVPTEWEPAPMYTGVKKWDLLGEYTFTEDVPVGAVTLTDLPNYTEFMIYFIGIYTSVATGDISFYVNDTRIIGIPGYDNSYKKTHLTLADIWHAMTTSNRYSNAANVPAEVNNYRDNNVSSEPAVKLQIKNMYDSSSFKQGKVVIYGGK